MERKEVNTILVSDFIDFLKQNNLYELLISGELLCSKCGNPITTENIACIYKTQEYQFVCDRSDCLREV